MKITKIEGIPIDYPNRLEGKDAVEHYVLVKLHTDEGIVGMSDGGYCSHGAQDALLLYLKIWGPILIGANPLDRELIMAKLNTFLFNCMLEFPAGVATVDMALWDLVGKIMNQPVYQLLGGKACEKLAYKYQLTGQGAPTPEEKAEQAKMCVAGGCRHIGIKLGPRWGNPNIEADVANVRAIRKAVPDNVNLYTDSNGCYDYTTALQICRRLEEFNLSYFEQPVPYWDIDGMAALRKHLKTPICAHESSTKIPGLMEVIKRGAADLVGLKINWVGGLSQAVNWGKIAKAANLGVYIGGPCAPWGTACIAHWLCSDLNYSMQAHASFGPLYFHNSFDTSRPSIEDIVVKTVVYKDGYFYPPDGPGFGMELNEEVLPKYIAKGKSTIVIGK